MHFEQYQKALPELETHYFPRFALPTCRVSAAKSMGPEKASSFCWQTHNVPFWLFVTFHLQGYRWGKLILISGRVNYNKKGYISPIVKTSIQQGLFFLATTLLSAFPWVRLLILLLPTEMYFHCKHFLGTKADIAWKGMNKSKNRISPRCCLLKPKNITGWWAHTACHCSRTADGDKARVLCP